MGFVFGPEKTCWNWKFALNQSPPFWMPIAPRDLYLNAGRGGELLVKRKKTYGEEN